MISRRSFIKNISLCSLLIATGNTKDGLAYISPEYYTNNEWPEHYNPVHICVVNVGEIGLQVGRNLPKGVCPFPYSHGSNNVIQFNPMVMGFSALLDQMHVVFLVGSFHDKDFWIARELVLESGAELVITITPNEFNSIFEAPAIPGLKESIISLPKNGFILSAANTINDVSSLLLFPIIIGIDLADIRDVFKNSYGSAFSIESSLKNSVEASKRLVQMNTASINWANRLHAILSYTTLDCTLEEIMSIGDSIHLACNNDAELIWGCSDNKHLTTRFRLTVLPVMGQ